MMIFTGGQLDYLRVRASQLLSKLKEWEKHDDNTKIGIIVNELMEICSMGHAIAFDEIQLSPWEWCISQCLTGDMDQLSREGWELIPMAVGDAPSLLWRRRSLRQPKEVKADD